ncbi:MAG: outer membrane protein OmpA family [Bacteroidota bacterium]|jgi:tetratricopeptide (TPR) repeat protein
MKKLVLIFLSFLPLLVTAQKKAPAIKSYLPDEVKAAKAEAELSFKGGAYNLSQVIYERLVVTEPGNADYNYKLGICYMYTNVNKAKAVSYMEFAANANSKDKPKDVTFDLGRAYFYAGLYDKALETYEKFRVEKHNSIDSKFKPFFDMHVEWATNANNLNTNSREVSFTNMSKTINSNGSDYRPLMGVADSVIYFSSKRKGTTGGLVDPDGIAYSDIFFWTQNDTAISKAKNAGINLNTPEFDELFYISPSGDKMITYFDSPETYRDLMISKLVGKAWEKPVALGKDFITKMDETGATLTPDGMTLYFSYEAPGSKTGKDIYVSTRTESTSWTKPERLGDNINSAYDDDYPSMWIDGKTLFFSSRGHGSIGGYDVFKVTMKDPKEGFSKPENIGYPLNTLYDDFPPALKADGKSGYVCQVRDSGLGDYDIYSFTSTTSLVEKPLTWIQGKTFALTGMPAKGAYITITDAQTGSAVATLTSNEASGRFDVALPNGTYKVLAKHAKLGRAEEITLTVNGEYKQVIEVKFPN